MKDFAYQLSVKIGEGYDASMLNIKADSPQELVDLLAAVPGVVAEQVSGAIGALKAIGYAAPLTQAAPAPTVQAPVAQAPVQAAGFTNVQQPTAPYQSPTAQAFSGVTAPQYAAPAAAPAAGPAGSPPVCQHGVKKYTTSKPGASRQWKAWMCPSPKGTADQCDPEWID